MKNVFYFMLKAHFVLKIFTFLFYLIFFFFFVYTEKQLDKRAKVTFIIYDVKNWIRNNHNTHIAQYLKK